MKKWFYVFMLSLMIMFGMVGCSFGVDDDEQVDDIDEHTSIHITIPKKRRSNFTEDIDTVSVIDENGEVIYECKTNNRVVLKLEDGVLEVTVPAMNDSCFDENGNLAE